MNDQNLLERITFSPQVLAGKPIIRGLRISVAMILELLAKGASTEEILEDYPELDPDDIQAALFYAYQLVDKEEVTAAILPDHLHFIWQLPPDDSNYSQRVSRLKVLFTRSLKRNKKLTLKVSASRRKHRESDVWQRRFWEQTIKNEADLQQHLDYIHYNPVKHGLVSCLWRKNN
ncbi:MAG: DUF433 domain-containing protein [Xenococcaceae cyanobacterium]